MMQPAALFEASEELGLTGPPVAHHGRAGYGRERPVAAPARATAASPIRHGPTPVYDWPKQTYLLAAGQLQDFVATAPVDEATRARSISPADDERPAPTNFPHQSAGRAPHHRSGGLNL
jgi:polyhydroxyalkanoate synthase